VAHLLHPNEYELIEKSLSTANVFRQLGDDTVAGTVEGPRTGAGHGPQFARKKPEARRRDKRRSDDLDFKTQAVRDIEAGRKSIIEPRLADHIRREALKIPERAQASGLERIAAPLPWPRPRVCVRKLARACLRRDRPGPVPPAAQIQAVHGDAATSRRPSGGRSSRPTTSCSPSRRPRRGPEPGDRGRGAGGGVRARRALEPELDAYHVFHAARADLLWRPGRWGEAAAAFERAGRARADRSRARVPQTGRLRAIRALSRSRSSQAVHPLPSRLLTYERPDEAGAAVLSRLLGRASRGGSRGRLRGARPPHGPSTPWARGRPLVTAGTSCLRLP
jgi:hypothetical protein